MSDDFAYIDRKRVDWVPGMPPDAKVYIREGDSQAYLVQIARLTGASRRVVYKWLTQSRYTVRLALRNGRHLVGVVVAQHDPEENRVLRFYASPMFPTAAFPARMLVAAALEQPEVGTTIEVPKDNVRWNAVVQSLGWPLVDMDDDTNTYTSKPYEPIVVPEVKTEVTE